MRRLRAYAQDKTSLDNASLDGKIKRREPTALCAHYGVSGFTAYFLQVFVQCVSFSEKIFDC